jgi:hypothetical protein
MIPGFYALKVFNDNKYPGQADYDLSVSTEHFHALSPPRAVGSDCHLKPCRRHSARRVLLHRPLSGAIGSSCLSSSLTSYQYPDGNLNRRTALPADKYALFARARGAHSNGIINLPLFAGALVRHPTPHLDSRPLLNEGRRSKTD